MAPHETTTHHFRLYKTGGAIDVSANNPKDSATRDEIRTHLSHIAKRFAAGDFDVPMFIHDTTPPGAPVMAKLRDQIRYLYTDTPGGAKIQISTSNPEALQAIYAFLRFQISDHQTGDATEVRSADSSTNSRGPCFRTISKLLRLNVPFYILQSTWLFFDLR